MKKVLYIFLGNINTKTGVTYKLRGLFTALEQKGTQCTLFTLSDTATEASFTAKNEFTVPLSYKDNPSKLYFELDKFIHSYPVFDIYFFRYPLANRSLLKFLKKNPGKFVFEHNTKELDEIKERAFYWVKKYKFKPTPSYARLIFKSLAEPVFNEAYYGKKVLQLAKKGVAVTEEIAHYEMSRSKNYTCTVLSNGVDVKKNAYYKRKFKNGDILNAIMLVSYDTGWHGVDQVVNSLIDYAGGKVKLTLIGNIKEDLKIKASGNKNILLTGYLSPGDFEHHIEQAHVGLGSFALYRINMEEASTLKVREYLATGLPVCLGYKDSDIRESNFFTKNTLQINTRESNLDWDKIYEWTVDIYKDENLNQKIREEALIQIDFSKKAEILLAL